jgi:quercetin dioxygenase-like cupin family protein
MKNIVFVSVALFAMGCGGAAPSSGATTPVAATFEGPPVTQLEIPSGTDEGRPIEPRVLLDAPHVKIVAIVLRDGTALPEHSSPFPVTIHAVSGAGTAHVGGEARRLDATHFVSLAPGVTHAIEPDAGTDMVLLVHHLR